MSIKQRVALFLEYAHNNPGTMFALGAAGVAVLLFIAILVFSRARKPKAKR